MHTTGSIIAIGRIGPRTREVQIALAGAPRSPRRRPRRAKLAPKPTKRVYDNRERAAGAEAEDRRDEIAESMRGES